MIRRPAITRLAIACLFLLLTTLAFCRFVQIDAESGYFVDEALSVIAAVNLFRAGVYSPSLDPSWVQAASAPAQAQVGYEVSVSSGIASTWSASIAFLSTGSLFAARLAFFVWNLVLAIWVAALAVARWSPTRASWSPVLGIGLFLTTLLAVPTAKAAAVYPLGELPGALLVWAGLILCFESPRLSAVILGLAYWHCKFIYLPFCLAGIVTGAHAIVLKKEGVTRWRPWLAQALKLLAYSFVPLLAWWVVIIGTTGLKGFAEYVRVQLSLSWDIFLDFSGRSVAPASSPSRSLVPRVYGFERFTSPALEFKHWPREYWVKSLALAAGGMTTALVLVLRRSAVVRTFGLSVGLALVALNSWFFFFHSLGWIRHHLPAALVSFGICAGGAAVLAHRRGPRWAIPALASVMIAVVAYKEIPRAFKLIEWAGSDRAGLRYSLACSFKVVDRVFEKQMRGCEGKGRIYEGLGH